MHWEWRRPNLRNQTSQNELQYNMNFIQSSLEIEPCSYYDPCGHLGCCFCGCSVIPEIATRQGPFVPLESCVHPNASDPRWNPFWGSWDDDVVREPPADDSRLNHLCFSEEGVVRPERETWSGVTSGYTVSGNGHGEGSSRATPVDGTPLRYVKENKRKRRITARLNKNRYPLPASGQVLGVPFKDTTRQETSNRRVNKFDCLGDSDGDERCRFAVRLRGKAEALVRFLGNDMGLEGDVSLLPPLIECGHLRSAVRACFPRDVAPLVELSIKTAQKAEKSCCKVCSPRFERKLSEWKEALRKPVDIDNEHLERFKRAMRSNVPDRWNEIPSPYIPNGSATLMSGVKKGGNWNEEEFSDRCRATLVFSSGKPRVVTCYSSYNTEVLTPLHESLYSKLGKLGWLLVGDPTAGRVAGLNGDGPFLSFDYVGATDSIKSAYTKAAIEILIDKGEGLSEEEVRCLRVLGDLKLWDLDYALNECGLGFMTDTPFDPKDYEGFSRGQPMGSAMSFPVLCLVNKTVVDLALTDLLESKKIGFNEWTSHRCLINGDDLLLREPHLKTDLRSAIVRNGAAVGLVVNQEKSMVSESLAEINSTLFSDSGAVQEKKTNANALYMKPDVSDVLGVAREATVTLKGFVQAVRANARLLARQDDKFLWKLPYQFQRCCWKDRKIRKALLMQPTQKRPTIANLLPVEPVPAGYDLDRDEEVAIIKGWVRDTRSDALRLQCAKVSSKVKYKTDVVPAPGRTRRSLIKKKKAGGDTVLSILAVAFKTKEKNRLAEEEALAASAERKLEWDGDPENCLALTYANKIEYLVDAVRGFSERTQNLALSDTQNVVRSGCRFSGWSLVDHSETEIRRVLCKA